MTIIRNSSSEHTGKKNARQIYSGYRINVQANQLGILAFPTVIKGASGDIVQSLREGPVVFTPAELTAILNNNSGSTAPSGPPPGPPGPPPTPLTFTSASSSSLFTYTILASYTLLTFTLIGGGGGGGDGTITGAGGGGGGGAYFKGSIGVTGGSIVQFIKGIGGASGQSGSNGAPTTLDYNNGVIAVSAGGGGGATDQTQGGDPGTVTGNNPPVNPTTTDAGDPGGMGFTNVNSDSGFPQTEYFPGAGGNSGNNPDGTVTYGRGGNAGTNGGGVEAGNDGYWEFTLS
jgi:hypothetical protein